MDAAQQSAHVARKMDEIRTANAPLCDLHGPMSSAPGGWVCSTDPCCAATGWGLDGQLFTYG
jgi:hypothetical protein